MYFVMLLCIAETRSWNFFMYDLENDILRENCVNTWVILIQHMFPPQLLLYLLV